MLESEADVLRAGAYTLEQLYELCEQRTEVARDGGHDPAHRAPRTPAGPRRKRGVRPSGVLRSA
jgi:hypothetical protein